MKEYIIYTDGACSGNPGIGGWAYIITEAAKVGDVEKNIIHFEKTGFDLDTTNQRMELTAVIESLNKIKEIDNFANKYIVYSDSAYLINCANDKWYEKWLLNNWKNSKGAPVANRDLWERLLPFFLNKNIRFIKTKGHADDELNNYVDKKAVEARKELGVKNENNNT